MEQNPDLEQQAPQLLQEQQQQQQPGMGDMGAEMLRQPGVIGPTVSGQVGQNPGASASPKLTLEQLLATLRGPNTPKQQYEILQILKNNPPLLAAFIKQRQALANQQHLSGQHGGGAGSSSTNQSQQHQPVYGSVNEQAYGQPSLNTTPSLVPSPRGGMDPPGISSVQQQLMQLRIETEENLENFKNSG